MPARSTPNKSKSAMKRVRQSAKRSLTNGSTKNMIKTMIKGVEQDVSSKNTEAAEAGLKKVVSAIDKAARKGILHRNTASRKVSRLTRLVNSILPAAAA